VNQHVVEVIWERNGSFLNRQYSRAHLWRFDGGALVRGSSSPDVVRLPFSDPSAVDPEEAFVAALSSCHMLWFLDLVARDGYVVEKYVDCAEGHMGSSTDNKLWLSRVLLSPAVSFSGARIPTDDAVIDLHHRAHQECFLANSVKSEIVIRGSWTHAYS
jgi:organic hydroperoxide reductase OsmC/OhrA